MSDMYQIIKSLFESYLFKLMVFRQLCTDERGEKKIRATHIDKSITLTFVLDMLWIIMVDNLILVLSLKLLLSILIFLPILHYL